MAGSGYWTNYSPVSVEFHHVCRAIRYREMNPGSATVHRPGKPSTYRAVTALSMTLYRRERMQHRILVGAMRRPSTRAYRRLPDFAFGSPCLVGRDPPCTDSGADTGRCCGSKAKH